MMKNSEYWRMRFTQFEEASHKDAQQVAQTSHELFAKAEKEIDSKVAVWYQRFATNNKIDMAEARRLLNTQELEEFRWDVQEYIKRGKDVTHNPQWIKQLENASAKFHITRLESLKLHIQQSAEVAFGNHIDNVDGFLKKNYLGGYYHTAFEIQKGVGVGWNIAAINDAELATVLSKPWAADKKNFSDRIWKDRAALITELQTQLTQNILLGKSPDDAINAIAKNFNTAKNNASRLVMTESSYISSQAQKDAFNDLDVERFEIVSVLDLHTSPICQNLDGKVLAMEDYEPGVTAPPFHPWCRSCTVPWFEDEEEYVSQRAARDEDGKTYYVDDKMKYGEWKEKFVQEEKTKAADANGNLKTPKDHPVTIEYTEPDSGKGEKEYSAIDLQKAEKLSISVDETVDRKNKLLILGDEKQFIRKQFEIAANQVLSTKHQLYLSEKACKPTRTVNYYDQIISKAIQRFPLHTQGMEKPSYLIFRAGEESLSNAVASYLPSQNIIFLADQANTAEEMIKLQQLSGVNWFSNSDQEESSLIHEMVHWYRAQQIKSGSVSYQQKLEQDQIIIDFIAEKGYNLNELSEYAENAFMKRRNIDEIIAEAITCCSYGKSDQLIKLIKNILQGGESE